MRKILLLFLLIFLISCAKISNKNLNEILISNGERLIKLNVEIADDNQERQKGLMFREKLNENSGMLFVFDEEGNQPFWMKNTMIPLDMIFIDKNFKIIDIKNVFPCDVEPCTLYKSPMPALYVLEVDSNFTVRNNIKVGDKIIFKQK